MDEEDDDIFHMLLKENKKGESSTQTKGNKTLRTLNALNEYDDHLPFDLKCSIDVVSLQTSEQSEKESKILQYVYKEAWLVLDHCRHEDFLYVLVDNNDMAMVYIYHLDCDSTCKPEAVAALQTSMKSHIFKATEKDSQEFRHLYVIHQTCSSDSKCPSDISEDTRNIIYIPPSLFASIFGKTTSLLNSAVVLLCTRDGCIYWRPIKPVGQGTRFCLLCQLHGSVNSVLCISVKKSDVDEHVVKTLRKALNTDLDTGDGKFVGLLIVCNIGECCLILPTSRESNNWEWGPVRFCLPHPVVCCVTEEHRFIYSTGWSIEATAFSLKNVENHPAIALENCVTLKMAKIGRIYFKKLQEDAGFQLMGLTSELDIIPISTLSSDTTPLAASTSHFPSDTLQNIQQHTSSIQELQDKSSALDYLLLQLNLFTSLYQQYKNKNSLENYINSSSIIHCECFFDHNQGYSKGSEVRVQLRNVSKVSLSDKWSVLVTTIPESHFSESKFLNDTSCFKMGGFNSGCKMTYSVPLPECIASDPLSQLRIRVALVLCVTQDICQYPMTRSANDKQEHVLEVEIHSQVFHYLHFLHVSSSDSLSHSSGAGYSMREVKMVLDRLREKKLKRKQKMDKDCLRKEKHLIKMLVPNLVDQNNKPEIKEEILQVLFQNIHQFPDCDNNPISCQSPCGTEICIAIEMITPVQSNQEMPSLQLRLESCDVTLLFIVHIFLLERFKVLMKPGQNKLTTKLDLENRLLSLRSIERCLSSNKPDQMISNLCKILDCLGTCVT